MYVYHKYYVAFAVSFLHVLVSSMTTSNSRKYWLQLGATLIAVCFLHSFFPSFLHSFIRSFIYSSIRSFVRPSIHPSIRPFTSSLTHFIHSFVHSFIHPFVRSSVRPSIHPSVHSLLHSLTSFIHLFIHSLFRWRSSVNTEINNGYCKYVVFFSQFPLFDSDLILQ